MIRALRRRHRRMIVLLAVVTPLAVAAGLLARPPLPRVPAVVLDALGGSLDVASWSDDLWQGRAIRTGLVRSDGRALWVLEPPRPLGAAEPVLYYTPRAVRAVPERLPGDAVLLGRLPPEGGVVRTTGEHPAGVTLLLYDLASQRLIAWAVLPARGGA